MARCADDEDDYCECNQVRNAQTIIFHHLTIVELTPQVLLSYLDVHDSKYWRLSIIVDIIEPFQFFLSFACFGFFKDQT